MTSSKSMPAWTKGSDFLFSDETVPEHLPGEPKRGPKPVPVIVARLLLRIPLVVFLGILSAFLWPFYLITIVIRGGRPPNVPPLAQFIRYFRVVWTVRPGHPGCNTLRRVWLTISVVRKVAVVPIWGLAWTLDEVLFRKALAANPVASPLIEISAGRSGSTQLARYLENDPSLAAPTLLQILFPYMWLWILVSKTIGRLVAPDTIQNIFQRRLPPELIQRHELNIFKTDSFDGALYLSHLNHLAPLLGPEVMVDDIGFALIAPHNQVIWESDFVELLDGIGRRTLAYAGPAADGAPRRFFVKGHFLCAAPVLEHRYPDARFLTMIRHPAHRLRSAINHVRTNPLDNVLGPSPWSWLAETFAKTETDYCMVEQKWFTKEGAARRCILRFSDYVDDLEAAMSKVYRECMDVEDLPPQVPRQHSFRKRIDYIVDRSLSQVGIDENAFSENLFEYIEWCR